MIVLLIGIGLVTSVYFFSLRELYGTIFLHNGLAAFGVAQALAATDTLAGYGQPNPAFYGMAAVVMLALVSGDLWLRALRRRARHS